MSLALALCLAAAACLLCTAIAIAIVCRNKFILLHCGSRQESRDVERGTPKVRVAAAPSKTPIDIKQVRRFSWAEIKSITDDFSSKAVIGEGGFSTVYLALLPPKSTPVAVKLYQGGDRLRLTMRKELDVLLRSGHPNIIRFLGFSDDQEEERVLVMEYAQNGNLYDMLHGGRRGTLSWARRMAIAHGVAAALDYLHDKCDPGIVHGDVTTANVLLDDKFDPKICDFGNATVGFCAAVTSGTSLRAPVMGSPGYADPYYLRTGLVSRKSDVYSFGVVLLELISGSKAFEESNPQLLVARTEPMVREKRVEELVDKRLGADYDEKQAAAVAELAVQCVGPQPSIRPTMADVQLILDQIVALGDLYRMRREVELNK